MTDFFVFLIFGMEISTGIVKCLYLILPVGIFLLLLTKIILM